MRASLLGTVVLFATEAFAASASEGSALDEVELVSGALLPQASTLVPIPSAGDIFELDTEMRAFIAPIAAVRDPRDRLLALVEGLERRGMFSLEYSEVTRTASATFRERQGNCLSFTILFVALARAAGLGVSYQTVVVPPTWSNDGQLVIASHINSVVRTSKGEETIVDFNVREYRGDPRSRRRVSDDHVLGLFFTNLGAEALLRGAYEASLAYLREAARIYPDIAGIWVNLGVLYSRHGHLEHAKAAYLRALEVDGGEPSALSNLLLVSEALGELEQAARYRARVQAYRERNPYYHYTLARRAYEEQEFAEALTATRRALRLKHDEPEFHALRGQALAALGRSRDARQSFERARELEAIEYERSQSLARFGGVLEP